MIRKHRAAASTVARTCRMRQGKVHSIRNKSTGPSARSDSEASPGRGRSGAGRRRRGGRVGDSEHVVPVAPPGPPGSSVAAAATASQPEAVPRRARGSNPARLRVARWPGPGLRCGPGHGAASPAADARPGWRVAAREPGGGRGCRRTIMFHATLTRRPRHRARRIRCPCPGRACASVHRDRHWHHTAGNARPAPPGRRRPCQGTRPGEDPGRRCHSASVQKGF